MDNDLLLSYLLKFKQWNEAHKIEVNQERIVREELIASVQSFTRERLENMTEDDLYTYLAPLWAMVMWGNKHYQINNIIEANGMDLLRQCFADLIYGTSPLKKRWDNFRFQIKGVGPAIMSELLGKTYPDKYLIWNKKTYTGFQVLGVPDVPRYEARLMGNVYEYLSGKGREIMEFARSNGFPGFDMMTLNTFIWQELQNEPVSKPPQEEQSEEFRPIGRKEAEFVHNDIRDKLADIGKFLGFHANVEEKIATGAVVDAIWDVRIGNMGQIKYVFEVQTAGSIDSLILNLLKAKNNKTVQGIVAVSDQAQLEKIRKEVSGMREIADEIKYWDYLDVLRTYDALQSVNETINKLGLVPPDN